MPTSLYDREQAFETKFAHDEEFRFLAFARRDKLFAHWAIVKLDLPEEAASTLVKNVLAIPNGPGHDQAVLQHIGGILSAHDAAVSDSDLAAALGRCMQEALKQLAEAPPHHSDGT